MTIKFTTELAVTNLDQLPRGTGAKYLEVMVVENDGKTVYVAKKWARKLGKTGTFLSF